MSIEHKPGILCVITGGGSAIGRSNIGRVVELVSKMKPGDICKTEGVWSIRNGSTKEAWLVKCKDILDDRDDDVNKYYALYLQSYLLPIQDPDQPFEDERKHQLHITVDKTLKVTEVDFVPNVVKA